MNAIIGFSGFLNNENISEEKRKYYISIIQKSSNQLLAIVTDILTISLLESNQEKVSLDKIELNELLSELSNIFQSLSDNKNIKLIINNYSHLRLRFISDKSKLTQVLSNLLNNAFKYSEQGSIELSYKLTDDLQYLMFSVKDEGIGIDKHLHEAIFDRFRQAETGLTRNYGGTGLGLSISKAFVKLLGGKIWVESEPNQGATFYFTIPYHAAE